MTNITFFWLIVSLFFLLFEMGHPGLFFFLSFSSGALLSFIASFFSNSLPMQSALFLVGTVVSFFVLRRWVKKTKYLPHQKTNVYALHGKRGMVIRKIVPPESGQVNVSGEVWSARSINDVAIDADQQIEVISVSGSHLVVKEI